MHRGIRNWGGLVVGLLFCVPSLHADEGRNLVDALVKGRTVGLEDVRVTMRLLDSAGKERLAARALRVRTLSQSHDDLRSAVEFTAPGNIRGTRLLVVQKGSESGQWIYLPSFKKTTRVSDGDEEEGILDSDLSYRDLRGESLDDYDYTMAPAAEQERATKACGGPSRAVYGRAKNTASAYARRLIFIHSAMNVVCEIWFLNAQNKYVKSLQNLEFRKYGSSFRPNRALIRVYDPQGKVKGSTEMTFSGWKVGGKADVLEFTPESLQR